MFARHPLLSLVTFAYLALVGWTTLTPAVENAQEGLLWDLAVLFDGYAATEWLTFNTLEFLANIALFVPFGLFFVLLLGRRRWWLAMLFGVALTCGIEFVQLYIPNRVSDVRDVVSNSSGALIGTLLALVLTAGRARRDRRARRAAVARG